MREFFKFFFMYYEVFSYFFFEYINGEFPAKNYCVLASENAEEFTGKCSVIKCILQGVAKIFRRYLKLDHFLLLSCSLEK